MRYRVFTRTPTGQYRYEATSSSLGSGPPEIQLIREAHGMVAGDIIHINEHYIELLELEDEPSYRYLALGMDISLAQAQQLYRQAVSAESPAA